MARIATPDDRAGGGVESCKQGQRPLARYRRQPARARDHKQGRQRGLCQGEGVIEGPAGRALPGGAAARAASFARGHGQRRRQSLQRARHDQAARLRRPRSR